tara:strand:+ start:3049 stop:3672 length:624 start_codon:yes stop_codon:yes gene_type:complete
MSLWKIGLLGLLVLLVLGSGCLSASNSDKELQDFRNKFGSTWDVELKENSTDAIGKNYLFTAKSSCIETNFTIDCKEETTPSCEEIIDKIESTGQRIVQIDDLECYGQRTSKGIFAECSAKNREVYPKVTVTLISQEEIDSLKEQYPECPQSGGSDCYSYGSLENSHYQIFGNGKIKVNLRRGQNQFCGFDSTKELEASLVSYFSTR